MKYLDHFRKLNQSQTLEQRLQVVREMMWQKLKDHVTDFDRNQRIIDELKRVTGCSQ